MAALVRTGDVAGDREGIAFFFPDMVLVALLQRSEASHPARRAEVRLVQTPDQGAKVLVLRGRAAAFGLGFRSGDQLAVERKLFGRSVGGHIIAERLPQLAALSGIALG